MTLQMQQAQIKTAQEASNAFAEAPRFSSTDVLPLTIPHMLLKRATDYPNAALFRSGNLSRTGTQMVEAVSLAAGILNRNGVKRADTVAIMSSNRVELLDFTLGCAWLGAVAVPINIASRGEQLEHIMKNCAAELVICEAEHVPLMVQLHEQSPATALRQVWVLDGENSPAETENHESDGLVIRQVPASDGTYANPYPSQPSETAAILYTSGTTGVSKGVECPQAQFYWWGVNMSDQLGLTEQDVLYTNLPLFHTNALNAFFQAVVCGGCYVLGPKFSASRFWSNLKESGATVTYLLGAMVSILNNRAPAAQDRDHKVRVALSPATPPTLHASFLERFGVLLLDGYGSTETNSVIGSTPDQWKPGMMGRLRPGYEIRIVDERGLDVPVGTPGELLIRSTQPHAVATGYYKMAEATVAAWKDLWFHSGDRIVADGEGWYRFVDRIKDVIRRRGENISSVEVESALRKHPAIADAAVYPVDSELGEDEVMAALVVREPVDFSEVADFLAPLLSSFAIPRFMRVMEQLPHTENGKVRKGALKEQGRQAAQWDRENASKRS